MYAGVHDALWRWKVQPSSIDTLTAGEEHLPVADRQFGRQLQEYRGELLLEFEEAAFRRCSSCTRPRRRSRENETHPPVPTDRQRGSLDWSVMIVAVSGIRDLAHESHADVERGIGYLIDVDEIRFGGAQGVDTVALAAAIELVDAHSRVIVPGRLVDQPLESQRVARRASEVVEMGMRLDRQAYLRRNDALLEGADLLVAFTNGRISGGTAYTMRRAREAKIAVVTVPVLSKAGAAREPTRALASIHGILPYTSPLSQPRDRATGVLRALRFRDASEHDVAWLAEIVATYIHQERELAEAAWLVPMPVPSGRHGSDLLPLVEQVAQCTGQTVLADWLVLEARVDLAGGLERFRCDAGAVGKARVVIVDHIFTRCSAIAAAQSAVLRETGAAPLGLAVLWSGLASTNAAASTTPA